VSDPIRRLRIALGGDDLVPLRRVLVRRLQRGRPLSGSFSIAPATASERSALERLLGRRPRSATGKMSVNLDILETQLVAAGLCRDLRHAIETLEGPVTDQNAARQSARDAWARLIAGYVPSAPWLNDPAAGTLLKRLSRREPAAAEALLEQASAVLARLPHAGTTRPVLAATVLGNAHALDTGQPVAALVGCALRAADGVAQSDADAWEAVGVFHSDLTRTVLTLNLPATTDTWLARVLNLHAQAGQPAHLTLRQLREASPGMFAGVRDVYVCENPAIVGAAAATLGPGAKPLVCVSGQPGSAVHRLLELLNQAGATLHYHGDFDAAGLGIAARLIRAYGARPWRLGTADYRAALARGRGFAWTREVSVAPTPWDPALEHTLSKARQTVHEEAVLDDLLTDLDSHAI